METFVFAITKSVAGISKASKKDMTHLMSTQTQNEFPGNKENFF